MSNRPAATLAGICAAAGLILGSLVTVWITSHQRPPGAAASSVETLVIDGDALRKMHAGDIIGATRLLQVRLDEELISLDAAVKRGFKLTPEARTAISQIKRLRDSTGYAPADPATQKSVADALALGSDDPNRFQ